MHTEDSGVPKEEKNAVCLTESGRGDTGRQHRGSGSCEGSMIVSFGQRGAVVLF